MAADGSSEKVRRETMTDTEDLSEDGWESEEDEEEGEGDDFEAAEGESGEGSNGTATEGAGAASGNPDGSTARRRRRRVKEDDDLEHFDERARSAQAFVADVVQKMSMDCRVRLRRPRDGDAPDEINLEILGKDAGRVIGKKGQVLQAL